MALAHVIANKAEAAYRRGDLFDKRRKLMDAWAGYCTTPKAAKVVQLRKSVLGLIGLLGRSLPARYLSPGRTPDRPSSG